MRRGAAGCLPLVRTAIKRSIRHSITCATLLFTYSSMKVMKQDSSFPVFVFLQFHPLWRDRTQRREKTKTVEDKSTTGARVRRAGRAVLPLSRTAGSASWGSALVFPATLCCFGNFMKKEGRAEHLGGAAGRHCSPDPWRLTSWAAEDAGWWEPGGGRESRNDGGRKEVERDWALAAAQLGDSRHCNFVLLPPAPQFHFRGL